MDEKIIGQLAKKVGEFSEAAEKVEKAFDEMTQQASEIAEIIARAREASEKEVAQTKTKFSVEYSTAKAEALPMLKGLVGLIQELLADEIKRGDC